jgi:adenine-specific DNA-methyltransferase
MDANRLVRELSPVDIAYLDPPYNQHQYGSNYHILNTIALWDRIPAPLELNGKGELREKAAIRKDWVKTRSPYCYRTKAEDAFSDVLENLDARRILISYSNDGLIPFEAMMDICEKKGRVSIISNEYTKFRGGRQSNSRLHSNIEFVLVIDGSKSANSRTRSRIRRLMLLRQAALLEKKVYKRDSFPESSAGWDDFELTFGRRTAGLRWKNGIQLQFSDSIVDWPNSSLKALIARLEKGACISRYEELVTILGLLESGGETANALLNEVPRRLKMLAHKKTRPEYEDIVSRLKDLRDSVDLSSIDRDLEAVKIQAEKRFEH